FNDNTLQGGTLSNGLGNLTGGYNWQGHKGFPDDLYPRSSNPADTPASRMSIFTPNMILDNSGSATNGSGIFLGPVMWNNTYYMSSFTIPVVDSVKSSTGGVM